MKIESAASRCEIDLFTRILHLGLVVFGILALATGDFAEDYKKIEGYGYLIHSWIGIGLTFFISIRFAYGFVGPAHIRFTNWVPYNKERLKLVWEDLAGLLRFKLPDRQPHQGLAALVEIFGLVTFLTMAVTGLWLFFTIEPGHRAQGITHFVKELHESGEALLPIFFIVHGGAVILHALAGHHLWRKMIFLQEK